MGPSRLTKQLRRKIRERVITLAKEEGSMWRFCEKAGINRTGIYKWLKHESYPGLASLVLIHEAYDVSLDWLLGYTDERRPGHDQT